MVLGTVVVTYNGRLDADWLRASMPLWRQAGVVKVILVGPASSDRFFDEGIHLSRIPTGQPFCGQVWRDALEEVSGQVLFCINGDSGTEIRPDGLHRLATTLTETRSSLAYCHYWEETPDGLTEHPTIDYQLGSVRDGFDFGPVVAFNMDIVHQAVDRYGTLADTKHGAIYDLRLRVSTMATPLRVPECLYTCRPTAYKLSGQRHFDYVDPRNREAQIEMEQVVTEHLGRIGARLPAEFKPVPSGQNADFPVLASVVIPVRNREKTIADAVRSALGQRTNFPFNVIVVDNHSTDKTTEILRQLASQDSRLVHLVPQTKDLMIGGCWNMAVQSPQCGRMAVQLDSDDLYAGPETLQTIADKVLEGPYAMVVASYSIVNFDLKEIPPGLIDHREWTRMNGHNNLLRVNGLGAPRAFDTNIARRYPFPNVSYGEDYAMGLRISREYEIGRIFESVYLCRRWEGNSDADLPIATKNRYDTYKDRIRTMEIQARRQLKT